MSELSNEVVELKGQLAALEEESAKDKQNLIAKSNQHKKEVNWYFRIMSYYLFK